MFGVNTTYNEPSGLVDHNGRAIQSTRRPGLDRDRPLSPSSQFAGVIGSGSNVLYNLFDQALQEDREDAVRRMMNDLHIRNPLEERVKAVESLEWEIECDDERDQTQKAMKEGITKVVRATKQMRKMIRYLNRWAVFKGRQGASVAFAGDKFKGGWGAPPGPAYMNLTDLKNPDGLERRKVPILRKHSPVDGDKIQWIDDGTPVILGNSLDLANIEGAEIANTTLGRGLVVRGPEWESRYIIHQYDFEDADYFAIREAGKAYGVGLRDALYWTWWLKSKWLGNITQFMQRFGLGVRAWLYEAGSDAARKEAEQAAASLDENSVDIMVPVWKDGAQRALEGIKFLDVGNGGTSVLRELIDYLDQSMEQLIIGQTLSSETEGSGLGGTGVAALHASTKSKIIGSDANDLGETFTSQWIRRLPVWIWGEEYRSLSDAFRFKFIVDQPNPTESLTAAATFVQLGGEVSEPALRRAAGMPEPKPGEKVISTINLAREQAQLAQEVQTTPPGQPTPQLPGEEQQGPTAADFEALLNGEESSQRQEAQKTADQETEQFSRAAIRFASDQVAGAVERMRCVRDGEHYARPDNDLALGVPQAPSTPVSGPGVKPRVDPGHGQANPEFINGKPHTTGEYAGKTPIAGAGPMPPKPKLSPNVPAAPPAAPVTPDLVATFAKKFRAKYGPKSMQVLRQRAQTAQGGVKLAAQALMQHMQGDTQPDAGTFAEIMKGFKPTEKFERGGLVRFAAGEAPRPPKPPAPKSPSIAPTGSPGRIDAGPPHPGRLSSVVPKIAGSTVLPKILGGPLVDRARQRAVAQAEERGKQPRTPDVKTPVKLHPDVARHLGTLTMHAPEAKAYLDQTIAKAEPFAHESPAAMKMWKGAHVLRAALDHAESGQYDPKHIADVQAKYKGMTVDPDFGAVPKPAKPASPSPKSTPNPETRRPADEDSLTVHPPEGSQDEPPLWLHNGVFGGGTAEADEPQPRQPWEGDPEAWRGEEHPAAGYKPQAEGPPAGSTEWKDKMGGPVPEGIPERKEGLTQEEIYKIARRDIENAESDYKDQDLARLDAAYNKGEGDPAEMQNVLADSLGANLFRTLYPDYVDKSVEKAASKHFGGTEPNLPVKFNVPSDYAGELLADYLEAHPPQGINAWHLKDMVSELRTGETRPERLFDPAYVKERWGLWNDKFKPFTPADFPGLKGLFKKPAPATPEVDPKTQTIANKLSAQYGDKAIELLRQKVEAWRADPQAAAKAARGEAVLKELERRKEEDAKGVDFQLEDDDGAGPLSLRTVPTDTPEFKKWFGDSKAVDAEGKPLVVYHGARRADRVGNKFDPKRATSGPMAFFTDDKDIASNYSTNKKDTSLEQPDDYAKWFKVKVPGARKPVDIDRAWWGLPYETRQKIAALAPRIGSDDAGEPVLLDEGHKSGIGNYDYEIKEQRGNALKAMVEGWLNGAVLFNDESKFLDVLKMAGLPDVEFHDPHKEVPGVFPVHLSIQNPLDTSNIPPEALDAITEAAKRKRGKAGSGADPWDKHHISGADFVRRLREDQAEGTSHAWTSIPDWATNALRSLGYDGIKDTGGKQGGKEHAVWIPFAPTQIKSAIGNRGTFDPNNPDITANTSNTQTVAPARPLEPHHEPIVKAFIDQLGHAAHLGAEKITQYAGHAKAAIARLTPQAAEHFTKNFKGSDFFGTVKELGQHFAPGSEKIRLALSKGQEIAGLYDRKTGRLALDGAANRDLFAPEETYHHEMMHAVDGPNRTFSSSPQWIAAWSSELRKYKSDQSSRYNYAGQDESEGFAEACRFAEDPEFRRQHPQVTKTLLAMGMIRPGADGEPAPAVFDQPINDGAIHADTLLPEGRQFALAIGDHVGFVPKSQITKTSSGYTFAVPTKAGKYTMEAQRIGNGVFDISFRDQIGSLSKTGLAGHGAINAMAAMGSALQTLIRNAVPREISFDALHEFGKEARANIYDKFARWIGDRTGYEVKVFKGRQSSAFDLIRKPDPLVPKTAEVLRSKFGDQAVAKIKEKYDELRQRSETDPHEPDLMRKMMRAREVYRELKRGEKGDRFALMLDLPRKSKAPVSVAPNQDQSIEKFVKGVNPKLDIDELPSLFGVPDDSTKTSIYMDDNDTVAIDVVHPDGGLTWHGQEEPHDIELKLKTDKMTHEPYMYIDTIFLKKSAQGKGTARGMVTSMVENAQKAGMKTIRCHAAKENPGDKNTPHAGYYAWPRMGFDTPLAKVEKSYETAVKRGQMQREKADEILGEMKKRWPDATSILDIMNTQDGRDFWRANGVDLYDARLDLTPGSKSLKAFGEYLQSR